MRLANDFAVMSTKDKNCRSEDFAYYIAMEGFEKGAKYMMNKAIKELDSLLDDWVFGGDADCIIAEFEERLNNE